MEMGAGALAALDDSAGAPRAAAGREAGGCAAETGVDVRGDDRGGACFALYNIMLPRMYQKAWQGNVFELRALDIANQLRGGDMAIDFDQIFAKAPHSGGSAFQWHQDQAYWPRMDADASAATCWLAVSDTTLENGCLRYLPGSHKEEELRPHFTMGSCRESATTLFTPIDEDREHPAHVPVSWGDLIVHHERCLHASAPNRSDGWRYVYVLSLHKAAWVAAERAAGITYSYDPISWSSWNRWPMAGGAEEGGTQGGGQERR